MCRRADDAGAGQPGSSLCKFGNTEIGDIGILIFIEEDVARFQVTVDDPLAVSIVKRRRQPLKDVSNFGERERSLLDAVDQRTARHITHHKKQLVPVAPYIIDRDDRGMLEPGDDLSLALEAFPHMNVVERFALQDLERHFALEHGIVSAIDCCHPTLPQFLS